MLLFADEKAATDVSLTNQLMGQKTTPIATRLYGNCRPHSCWYSDANPFSLFYQDFNHKQFFDGLKPPVGRRFGFRPASIICHQFPKKSSIHIFFLRRKRRVILRGRRRVSQFARRQHKKTNRFQYKGLRMPVNRRLSAIDVLAIQHLYANTNQFLAKPVPLINSIKQLRSKRFLKFKNLSKASAQSHMPTLSSPLNKLRGTNKSHKHESFVGKAGDRSFQNKVALSQRGDKRVAITQSSLLSSSSFGWNRPYNTHIRELVRLTAGSSASIVPLRLNSMMVSASLIATHLRALLQQKNQRFKSVCKWLFKDISKYPAITGVRISCSGRLYGKPIARTDLRKQGQTSLHTLKNKIDYAQSMAITRYGVLGIKVWVSYFSKHEEADHKKEGASKRRFVNRFA